MIWNKEYKIRKGLQEAAPWNRIWFRGRRLCRAIILLSPSKVNHFRFIFRRSTAKFPARFIKYYFQHRVNRVTCCKDGDRLARSWQETRDLCDELVSIGISHKESAVIGSLRVDFAQNLNSSAFL